MKNTQIMDKEKRTNSIVKNTIIVTFIIIVGKLFGFARESIIASFFGANSQTDAFFLALSMPGIIFPAVCSSLSTAFIPLYISKINEGEHESNKYASQMLFFTTLIGLVLGVVGAILSQWIVPLFAPGFRGEQLALSIVLTRVTMLFFVLTMLQYMISAILNSKHFYIGSQIAGLFYNISIIVFIVLLGRSQSMMHLTIVVNLGLFVNVLILVFCCKKVFRFSLTIPGLLIESKRLIKLALPILLGNSVVQLNNIVDKVLGSLEGEGALSALNYSNTLILLVLNIFITSLSTVLFPNLADSYTSGKEDEFSSNVQDSICILNLILVPITCVTILCANNIISIAYGRGAFKGSIVLLTSGLLLCFAPRILFSSFREILNKAFYAMKDTKTPMVFGAIGVGINILLSIFLVKLVGINGIALGTSVSTLVCSLLLMLAGKRRIKDFHVVKISKTVILELCCGIIASLLFYFLNKWAIPIESSFLRFVFCTFFVFAFYSLLLFFLKDKYFIGLIKRLKNTITNKRV